MYPITLPRIAGCHRTGSSVSLEIVADAPARGAGLNQVIGLSIAAVVITVVMLWAGYAHRTHRIKWLNRIAERCGRMFKRPPWAAPSLARYVSATIGLFFGFIWDVAWHFGNGRDAGPLNNPAHYFIVDGLFGIFFAGVLAIVVPFDKPGPAAVRITRNWYAPVGGVLLAGCGLYALAGFPLDDLWHRIFGQDVTLWGPTHLMMIGGGCFSMFAVLLLDYEARRTMPEDAPPDGPALKFMRYFAFGVLLVALSLYQVEYDFGVEQFRLVLQPMMIAAAAALALVAARITLGQGAAIAAALLAAALRGIVAFLVGPVLGAPISWFPLYFGAAVVIEFVGLTPLVKRPMWFGAIAGLGVATGGLLLEWLWINAVYPHPWPATIWGEVRPTVVPVAVLTGLCGALLAMVLTGQRLPRRAIGIGILAITALTIGGAVANGLRTSVPTQDSATITLTDLPSNKGQRMVSADVQINPPTMVSDHPDWVTILAWQGRTQNHRGRVIDRLDRVGPGHYRSAQPIPVLGSWKTMLRIQDGTTMAAVPIYLPADPAIPAPQIPAETTTRNFVPEITIMQRERDQNTPASLFAAGSVMVLALSLTVIAALAWGADRINATETKLIHAPRQPRSPGFRSRRGRDRTVMVERAVGWRGGG